MSKFLFLGLSAMLIAAGTAAKTFAEGVQDPMGPEDNGTTGEEAPKRGRGRPAAATGKPEVPAETPAGPNDEERFAANRTLIQPLVENGQGDDVKKVIGKYSEKGLKNIPAESQKAFEKDIAALAY